MSESGFASLGPTLLARKGGAKPAMRPQLAPLALDESDGADDQLEDLGWNDMGDHGGDHGGEHGSDDESDVEGGADIVPINSGVAADDFANDAGPVVRRQQRRLEERVLADAAMTGPADREPEYDDEDEAFYGEDYAEDEDYAPVYAQSEEEDEDEEEDGQIAHIHVLADPVAVPAAAQPRMPAVQSGRRAAFTLRLDADRHLKLRLAATMKGVSAQVLVTEALDRLLAEYGDLDVIANHLKRH
jgi:predicted HicB family RNase H-like nuclease